MNLSVVIPCYNEAENIPLILKRFAEIITNDIEIILVNNGSTDNSDKILKELLPKFPFVKLINVPINKGYGYGILQGLKSAESDYIGWTHADMQTDPYDVIKAWKILKNSLDNHVYVKGNRTGRPLVDLLFTHGMSIFETIYMGRILYDINAQPNIFPKDFFCTWINPPNDFSLDLYAIYMAKQQGLKIIRFPVSFPERIHGASKWQTGIKSKLNFIKRTIVFSIKLKRSLK